MWPLFSFAQESQPASELATRQLLKHADDLLKNRKAAEAVPVLEEVLLRLEGLEEANALEARASAQYQLGLCCLAVEQYEQAAETFQLFVQNFPEHESVLDARFLTLEAFAWQKDPVPMQAYIDALKQSGEFDRLLSVLGQKNDATRHAALSLVSAYSKTADFKSVQRFLPFCDEDALSDVGLNLALMDGGDLAVESGEYLDAMQFYREVQLSAELMVGYDRRLVALTAELEISLPWVPLVEREAQQEQWASETNRYERMVTERANLEKKNYDQDLMVRMANCYDRMERRWNAYVIYHHVYTDFPESRSAERSRYSAFQCLAALEEMTLAQEEAKAYLELYPVGRYRDAVTLGLMQIHLHLKDFPAAEALGLILRAQEPEHRYCDQVTYLLGYLQFERQNYEAALDLFQKTASTWPERIYAEEAVYWQGMCSLFLGRFADAVAVFEGYLNDPDRNPKTMEDDVTFRLGMARYGLGEYETCKEIFKTFLTQFPDSDLLSEACSMLGDLYGADGEMNPALAYYAQGRECAVNAEQESYAVFQAVQVYDLLDRHEDLIALLEDYLNESGEEGDFAKAVLRICASRRALEQGAQALDACFNAIVRFGNTPLEQADLLFTDLQDEVIDPLRGGVSADEVLQRLGSVREAALGDAEQGILALRLTALFAGISENPEAYDAFLFSQESLELFTPLPLRRFAEVAAARGETDRAEAAFKLFEERYGDSEDVIPMMNVLLRFLLDAGRYDEALTLADDILMRYPDAPAASQTHLLDADALRLSKRYDEAIEKYKAFASVRAWRGPRTPQALYWTGVCQLEQGNIAEACAWFQRAYVLYGQYPEWTAKAYAASVECLQKLGQQEDVIRTWREMVADPNVVDTPEGRQARAELSKLQEAVQ